MTRGLAQFLKMNDGLLIHVFSYLSEDESRNFCEMSARLRTAWAREQLFFWVNFNCNDVGERAFEIPKLLLDAEVCFEDHCENAVFQVSRLFANYLSSVRMYLDHIQAGVKRTFGPKSRELERFSEACSKEYDEVFEYRFLYALRNYTQHCGNPVNAAHADERLQPDGTVSGELHPGIAPAALSKFEWKKGIADELRAVDGTLDLLQLMTTHMNCIRRIHSVVISLFKHQDRPPIDYFSAILNERPDKASDVFLFQCQDIEQLKRGGQFKRTPVSSFQVSFLRDIHGI